MFWQYPNGTVTQGWIALTYPGRFTRDVSLKPAEVVSSLVNNKQRYGRNNDDGDDRVKVVVIEHSINAHRKMDNSSSHIMIQLLTESISS